MTTEKEYSAVHTNLPMIRFSSSESPSYRDSLVSPRDELGGVKYTFRDALVNRVTRVLRFNGGQVGRMGKNSTSVLGRLTNTHPITTLCGEVFNSASMSGVRRTGDVAKLRLDQIVAQPLPPGRSFGYDPPRGDWVARRGYNCNPFGGSSPWQSIELHLWGTSPKSSGGDTVCEALWISLRRQTGQAVYLQGDNNMGDVAKFKLAQQEGKGNER